MIKYSILDKSPGTATGYFCFSFYVCFVQNIHCCVFHKVQMGLVLNPNNFCGQRSHIDNSISR